MVAVNVAVPSGPVSAVANSVNEASVRRTSAFETRTGAPVMSKTSSTCTFKCTVSEPPTTLPIVKVGQVETSFIIASNGAANRLAPPTTTLGQNKSSIMAFGEPAGSGARISTQTGFTSPEQNFFAITAAGV